MHDAQQAYTKKNKHDPEPESKIKKKNKNKMQNFANLLLCHAEIHHYTCSKRIAIYSVSNRSRGVDRVF